jgi:peptidyl-prolyl cis-trans isomerase SurA
MKLNSLTRLRGLSGAGIGRAFCILLLLSIASPGRPLASAQTPAAPAAEADAASKPQELDRVIAIINGDVLLQSDVLEEMQFASIQPLGQPGLATDPSVAGRRLINRTLILQQMKSQQADIPVSDQDLQKSLSELRKQIPACARFHCDTPDGWRDFLKQNNLTEQQVTDRWRQRLQIVNFIDIRFRNGVRITKPEIQEYYDKTFVPAFQKESAKPPVLPVVSNRIEEILLQRRVNGMLQDWLKSLRDQGSVQILDPMYGVSSGNNDEGGGAA